MNDNVHKMWSDDELDQSLSALHAGTGTDDAKLRQTRAELITAAGGHTEAAPAPPRRHRGRWAVAAAAVIVLVAGLLIVQTMQFGDNPAPASAAAQELNSAADKIGASDPPMRPGQYHYIVAHSWSLSTAGGANAISMLVERRGESWVPQNPKEECLLRLSSTGIYKWVKGSEADATAMAFPLPTPWTEEQRERCIDREGNWQQPTPKWLVSLPRDPRQLYELLREATADRGQDPDLEMLVYVADALRGGMVPADLRAALYRALAKIPALEITDKAANLDGRSGIALGIDRAGTRHDMIIDPATGQFIGERQVATKDFPQLPAGTATSTTSVTSSVVDAIGATK